MCIRDSQETKYARQAGGKGQYGHVKIKIEPNEPGKGYEFVNAIVGGAIPKEYIPAIDNGIQGAMKSGVLAGYPVVDVKVTLWDGSHHTEYHRWWCSSDQRQQQYHLRSSSQYPCGGWSASAGCGPYAPCCPSRSCRQ